jgi:hypothetical protein
MKASPSFIEASQCQYYEKASEIRFEKRKENWAIGGVHHWIPISVTHVYMFYQVRIRMLEVVSCLQCVGYMFVV